MAAGKPRYFVIFGTMRTGSNLLERTLGACEGLSAEGEVFNEIFIGKPDRVRHLGWTLAERKADPVGYLEVVLAEARGIPGFRIFDRHDAAMIDHAARDPDCARIVLTRDPLDSYLSLKIAAETGQWLLSKEENRKLAKVAFDAAEFDDYRDAVAAHYAGLRRKMRAAGQTAFEISYDELGDLEIVAGAAAHVGATAPLTALPQKIKRQNPEDWRDKVTNPGDVEAWFAAQGRAAPPRRAPDAGRVDFEPLDALVAARGLNLLFAPIEGAGAAEFETLMRGAERAAGVAGKPLAHGLKPTHVARRRRRGAVVASFARHPAARLYDLFRRRVASQSDKAFSGLRAALAERYGAPADVTEETEGAAFDALLAFIADNRAGRTAFPADPGWAPQTVLLSRYGAVAPLDVLGRVERFAEDADPILRRLGVAAPEALTATFSAAVERAAPAAGLARILTSEREKRIVELYEPDFERLGYARMTQG